MTNRQLVKRYLQLCKARGLTDKTINGYMHDLNVFLEFIKDMPLDQVTPYRYREFYILLSGRKRKWVPMLLTEKEIL